MGTIKTRPAMFSNINTRNGRIDASVQNKIHKQKILSDTRIGILGRFSARSIRRSDEFQKVCSLSLESNKTTAQI